jgi:hypothetical protein
MAATPGLDPGDRPGGEAGRQRPEPGAQRDVQTVGEEGHEDVRVDALLQLVIDRP